MKGLMQVLCEILTNPSVIHLLNTQNVCFYINLSLINKSNVTNTMKVRIDKTTITFEYFSSCSYTCTPECDP